MHDVGVEKGEITTAQSPSYTGILRLGSRIGSPTESQKIEKAA